MFLCFEGLPFQLFAVAAEIAPSARGRELQRSLDALIGLDT